MHYHLFLIRPLITQRDAIKHYCCSSPSFEDIHCAVACHYSQLNIPFLSQKL